MSIGHTHTRQRFSDSLSNVIMTQLTLWSCQIDLDKSFESISVSADLTDCFKIFLKWYQPGLSLWSCQEKNCSTRYWTKFLELWVLNSKIEQCSMNIVNCFPLEDLCLSSSLQRAWIKSKLISIRIILSRPCWPDTHVWSMTSGHATVYNGLLPPGGH